ncbi:MAG: hypothetical protein ACPHNW_08395, partial [Pseudoalteromonas tetraodonis]
ALYPRPHRARVYGEIAKSAVSLPESFPRALYLPLMSLFSENSCVERRTSNSEGRIDKSSMEGCFR